MRYLLSGAVLALLISAFTVACDRGGGDGGDEGGESSASISAPLLGTWTVWNEDGLETGQMVMITNDHITMQNTMGIGPTEASATFSRSGDDIVADWNGAPATFTEITEDRTVLSQGGGVWILTRQ